MHEDQEEEQEVEEEVEEEKEWVQDRALIRDEVSSCSREKVISQD